MIDSTTTFLMALLANAVVACSPTRHHDGAAAADGGRSQKYALTGQTAIHASSAMSSSPPTKPVPSRAADAADSEEARAARLRLVRIVASRPPWDRPTWDPNVLAAMRQVPRHAFMPGVGLAASYRDAPHPIGHGQTISQPSVVALMTNALSLKGDERVLEIGTGSGYQAAVLSGLCAKLYTIELLAPLGEAARSRLKALGYQNVTVRIGDGYLGWAEEAPFDRIILTAAPERMPPRLLEQLAEGGVIVAPVGDAQQQLVRWQKEGGRMVRQTLGAVRFVPMVH